MSKNICQYVEKQRIIRYLDESRPVLTDWRMDNGEGLTLQEIRYNAACNVYDEIRNMIENPYNVADVAPVVHSKWTGAPGYLHCPECGAEPFEISPYCPGCGAKMDESEESNDKT